MKRSAGELVEELAKVKVGRVGTQPSLSQILGLSELLALQTSLLVLMVKRDNALKHLNSGEKQALSTILANVEQVFAEHGDTIAAPMQAVIADLRGEMES